MIKRSFFGLKKSRFMNKMSDPALEKVKTIPMPKQATLLSENSIDPFYMKDKILIKAGETIKTGQKLPVFGNSDCCVISTVTGTISSIDYFSGIFGSFYTAVKVDVAEKEDTDNRFKSLIKNPTLETVKEYLGSVPGNFPPALFHNKDQSINTIVVCGVDKDLFITVNQYTLATDTKAIKNGIAVLKQLTGIENIIFAAPDHLIQEAAATGVEVRTVDPEYPSTFPHMIMKNNLGQIIPAGKSPEDMGVCFVGAEAVASIGKAFDKGNIPVFKTFNLIHKDQSPCLVSARIGTPVGEVFSALNITTREKDRIIFGGPMTGSPVYTEDHPICPDTDAVIIQAEKDQPLVSDYPCTNCGECIRICPAGIPVNMLVRFLETEAYREAADQYDLYSCIECGLCSFVCVSKMPILQYIKLAKYELDRVNASEATHA